MTKCYLRGFGSYAPDKVLTNADLEKMVDTTDEWIRTRTGIRERHIAAEGQATSDLAVKASEATLSDAGLERSELTHILTATCTPDAFCPNTACLVEHKLGLKGLMAFDISAACSGFLYGLQIARSFIAADSHATVLVSGAETMSSRVNWKDRNTCVLFGDGAGATIVSAKADEGAAELVDIELSSDGSLADLLVIQGGGSSMPYQEGSTVPAEHFVVMQGREVFKHAVRSMTSVCETILQRNGMDTSEVDMLIPHQANVRIIEAVGKKLNIPAEKVFINVDKYGNTSAASIALALADARSQGMLKKDMKVLLTTFGGGFTWGSVLLQF